MVTDLRCWWQNHNVFDSIRYIGIFSILSRPPTLRIGHQHPKVVAKIRHQYRCGRDVGKRSPTSMMLIKGYRPKESEGFYNKNQRQQFFWPYQTTFFSSNQCLFDLGASFGALKACRRARFICTVNETNIVSQVKRTYQTALKECKDMNGHLCKYFSEFWGTPCTNLSDTPSLNDANEYLTANGDLWTDLKRGRSHIHLFKQTFYHKLDSTDSSNI